MDELDTDYNIDSAAEALLKRWNIKEDGSGGRIRVQDNKPEPTEEEEEEEETEEETPEDEPVEQEEETEEETPEEVPTAGDDHEVDIQVGDEKKRVKVADLKRLYGQEASLTQKSQAVAAQHKAAEEVTKLHLTALEQMHTKAQEALAPYDKIDWVLAQAQVTPEEFQALRAQYNAVKANVDYFEQELGQTTKKAEEQRVANLKQAGMECLAQIDDVNSPHHIPDFKDSYNDLRAFAVKHGSPQQVVDDLVDPVAWKILHMAMSYEKLQSATKPAVKKLAVAPKNVAGKTPSSTTSRTSGDKAKDALNRLRKSGNADDAAELLLARWSE